MTSVSKITMALAAAGLTAGAAGTAHAVATYGNLADPGYYAGNGPANGNFTIDTTAGIEVGLRAKDRQTVTSIDGSSGIYVARAGLCTGGTGFCGPVTNKALWNYEFSVNTQNAAPSDLLGNYRVELRIDTDRSAAVNFVIISDAYTNWGDNEYIDGAGPKRIGGLPIAGENGVQQSVNPLFGNSGFQTPNPFSPFDPFAAGLYEIEISVYAATDTAGLTELAGTDITVQVIPEPASALLVGLGLAGLGFIRRRKVAA